MCNDSTESPSPAEQTEALAGAEGGLAGKSADAQGARSQDQDRAEEGTVGDAPEDREAGGGDAPVGEGQRAEGGPESESRAEGGDEGPQEPEDEVDVLRTKVKRTHDRLLRTAADLENYRRRARRDMRNAVAQAEEKIASRFLPIMDNLERAIAHAEDNTQGEDSRTLLDGVKMVHKQFRSALADCQIEPFESMGQPFDPELHEAIQQAESDAPRNTVTLEVQKGYRRGERLVRPAMVVVSSGPASGVDEPVDTGEGDSGDEDGSGAQPASSDQGPHSRTRSG